LFWLQLSPFHHAKLRRFAPGIQNEFFGKDATKNFPQLYGYHLTE
jgi:hypothetical protein